ncbi:hypothetical protein D3C78_1055850 [compost metagenome]
MNHLAPLLVQCGVVAITVSLVLVDTQRIKLQPHMTKQRGQAPEGNAVLAESGVAFMMTDMRAHHFRREEIAHATLDGVALQRVIVVRRPKAVAAGQHFVINTTTTRRAGFKFNLRETFAQHIQQTVELAGLRVGRGFTVMARLHQFAVHVPLHIINRMFTEQPAQAFE